MNIKELQKNPPYGMIAILFIGAFAAFLNNTLLNIALPTIMVEFSVKPSQVQWVTTSYMLINGILIPTSAFFIQKYTNRRVFLVAMSLFTIGTLVAMISPTFTFLLIGRMLQASGSAMMMPLLMNVMLTAFPIERRGTAMGFFGLVMFVAPAIGPTLSGWVIEHYSWRTLFGIILPFGLITLAYALFRLRNITPNRDVDLDYFSLVLSSIGFGSLLYGFSMAGEAGWVTYGVSLPLIVGIIALTIFVIRQLRLDEPMLDFKIYKYPMFALSSVISATLSIGMFSGMILTPLYVQTVRDISPFHSGVLMLPGAVLMGLMSPITGRVFDRYGARIIAVIGLTIMTVSTFLFTKLTMEVGYFSLMTLYTVRMFGMSLVMMPVMTNGLNQLPMRSNPHGTAMNNTLQQVSGAIGTAVLLTIMTKRSETTGKELFEKVATGELLINYDIEKLAMLDGIKYSFLVATYATLFALVLAFFLKRTTGPKNTPE